jgi:tau tubulin kinase
MLAPGEILGASNHRKGWKVDTRIGQGTFAEIYSARDLDGGPPAAIKLEKQDIDASCLDLEGRVLSAMQKFDFVPTKLHSCSYSGCSVLIMELLGPSLSSLRHRQSSPKLPVHVCVQFGLQMLKCVEALHGEGFVHRDIKPSNFVFGRLDGGKDKELYIIDFGLCKMYRETSGAVMPPKSQAQFRGTSMYASVHSHLHESLAPRDDLWSLLYVVLDQIRGSLPWAQFANGPQKDRKRVTELKQHYREKPEEIVAGISTGERQEQIAAKLVGFANHLKDLKYHDTPDYALLRRFLTELGELGPEPKSAGKGDKALSEGGLTTLEIADFQWDVKELLERQNISHTPREGEDDKGDNAGGSKGSVPGSTGKGRGGYSEDVPSALRWQKKAQDTLGIILERKEPADVDEELDMLNPLLKQAEACKSFFSCEFESIEKRVQVQRTIFAIETAIETAKARPPPVIGFGAMQQKMGGSTKKRKIQLGEE